MQSITLREVKNRNHNLALEFENIEGENFEKYSPHMVLTRIKGLDEKSLRMIKAASRKTDGLKIETC